MRLRGENVRHILDRLAQVHLDALQLEFSRLNLREIQDVVDDAEQPIGAVTDGLRVIALAWIERGIEQQGGHADHAVHRRADLVAHVGEKL